MKGFCTIIFLCFIITQTFAQSSINVEAIRYYIANNPPKENERLVNEMYSQKERMGIESFDSMKIQILYEIAHQCPDIGGTAVYRARSIYSLIEFDTYNDDCDNLAQAKSGNIFSPDSCIAEVLFSNPSLEGPIGVIKTPPQWATCAFSPDTGPLGTSLLPSNGTSYLRIGAIIGGQESVGQFLLDTLYEDMRYAFLVDDATCAPISGFGPTTANFSIWLGDSLCHKGQLIDIISTTDTLWHTHKVSFTPNKKYTHLVISAEGTSCNYIDNLRSISQPLCDSITSAIPTLPDKTEDTGNDVYTNITTTVSSEFKIYPNPNTQGQLTVEWTNPIQNGKLVLVDALGKAIKQYIVDDNVISQQVDIQALPSGYYTVLLETNKQIIGREKLIVIKH